MKRTVSALLGLAALAAIVIATTMSNDRVRTVHAQSGCSLSTLKGNYGFSDSGFSATGTHGTAQFAVAAVGVVTFDGAGNASGSYTASFNGKANADTPFTGIYTVNSDCSGLLTSTDGADNFAFVIVGGGADVLATDISPATTASLEFKRQ
jgi:hypothetical protein